MAFKRNRTGSICCVRQINSTLSHPASLKSISIFSSHLPLGLKSSLFPSGFPAKIVCNSVPCQLQLISFNFRNRVISDYEVPPYATSSSLLFPSSLLVLNILLPALISNAFSVPPPPIVRDKVSTPPPPQKKKIKKIFF